MLNEKILIKNRNGIDAHDAGLIIMKCRNFDGKIKIEKEGSQNNLPCNGQSISALLSLNFKQGDTLVLTTEGNDEHKLFAEISAILQAQIE